MKKFISLFLATVVLVVSFAQISLAVSVSSNSITSSLTPTQTAQLKYSKKFGANFKGMPSAPVVVGDTLLVVSGSKLYKLEAETGKEISSVKLNGSSMYATVSPLYAEGKIFVQLDGGIVQAFDFQTMKSLWIYTDSLGGQALCPITYSSGYIYTGFWNDETEYANYVCLSIKDENTQKETEKKSAKWTYKALGGFYWAGCAVSNNYVVFGKDDGKKGSTSSSKIICLNKSTGKSVSTLAVTGDIRSSVIYSADNKAYYVSSKGGYVYKFSMNSSNGKLTLLKTHKASGAVTATPVIYKNRLYVGSQNGNGGKFSVLNADTMKEIYSLSLSGYPQATALVSNGYENSDGKIYVYFTMNNKDGAITVLEDSASQTSAKSSTLFLPESSMREYSISTITADDSGTLYYKNDSGNIFAVTKKSNSSFFDKILSVLRNILKKIFFIFQ